VGRHRAVTLPWPEAVLVDHPAVPVPCPSEHGLALAETEGSPIRSMPRRDRTRIAVQLLATSAILMERDLWPGRRALRRAVSVARDGVVAARLGGFPLPLTVVRRRLQEGESLAIRLAAAVRDAVGASVGLQLPSLPSGVTAPGMALDSILHRMLARLPRPLDPGTARSLWGYHVDAPQDLEDGEISLLSVADPRLALRLGAAHWLAARRRGRMAWLWCCAQDEATMPLPPAGCSGVLAVVGEPREVDLAAVDRWVAATGGSAVVVGRLPRGWSAGRDPVAATSGLPGRLVLVGAAAEECARAQERWAQRFDPLVRADREALTRAATRRFGPVEEDSPADAGVSAEAASVRALLALLPDGVPESLLAIRTGLAPDRLNDAAQAAGAVRAAGRWRLVEPEPLVRDPLHAETLAFLPPGDPCRLRHAALAGGSVAPLQQWCRERLDALEGAEVRAVLGELAPGALGTGIQALLVEGCLSELDIAGARAALEGLDEPSRRQWLGWMDAVDPPPAPRGGLLEGDECATSPRCRFEVALRLLRTQRRFAEPWQAARDAAEAALDAMAGALRNRCRLELTAALDPERLRDRDWRRALAAGQPEIWRRVLHLRANRLETLGRPRPAHRLLSWLDRGEDRPGPQGLLQQDLSAVALAEGRRTDAERHALRAFRLLSAAGFRYRTRTVLFNLAVADIDALRLERAERRLRAAESGPDDPFTELERVRIALARGQLEPLRRGLERFHRRGLGSDPRFGEASAFLEGASALLDGEWERARELLARGGQEGESWSALLDAVQGGEAPLGRSDDGWGVGRAARVLSDLMRRGQACCRDVAVELTGQGPSGCLALGLVEELVGRQRWLGPRERTLAAATLESAGLSGWARRLAHGAGPGEGFIEAVSDLVDGVRPTALEPARARAVLDALGVEGLEVLRAGGGPTLWRIGHGEAGARVRWGELEAVPLGGEVGVTAAWRLLEGVLRAALPALAPTGDMATEDTGLYGVSDAVARLRGELRELAPTGVTVALFGETGSGKDVAARALHRLSGRTGQLVSVNVAAIPASLLEAELFGSVKGAFTGADRARRGLIQAADGGTLFLDEIGDLDAALQAKLLRFLESREVRPVGSDRTHRVDVRIVTATHHDLEARMRQGSFRRDLYFRIAGSPIRIPPLRERLEDVPVLRALFVEEAVRRDGLSPAHWSAAADSALRAYDWPGNVRELKHVVEVALVRARGGTVGVDHLPIGSAPEDAVGGWEESMRSFRRRLLRDALRRSGGNRTAAARELGISRQTLLYHLRELGMRGPEA